jgi:hypothetical protein
VLPLIYFIKAGNFLLVLSYEIGVEEGFFFFSLNEHLFLNPSFVFLECFSI